MKFDFLYQEYVNRSVTVFYTLILQIVSLCFLQITVNCGCYWCRVISWLPSGAHENLHRSHDRCKDINFPTSWFRFCLALLTINLSLLLHNILYIHLVCFRCCSGAVSTAICYSFVLLSISSRQLRNWSVITICLADLFCNFMYIMWTDTWIY